MCSAPLVLRAAGTTPAIYPVYLVFPSWNQQFSWWLAEHAPGAPAHKYMHICRSWFSSNKMERVLIAVCVSADSNPLLCSPLTQNDKNTAILPPLHPFLSLSSLPSRPPFILPFPPHYLHLFLSESPFFPSRLFLHLRSSPKSITSTLSVQLPPFLLSSLYSPSPS